ncbi:unnamed protein product [marine sediment metagenome]|uniref:Uncharacterized protein n=1 Tax=marine sediment metagenome TaxID=412755 RepID=X1JLZ5_9ZZZZ
MEMYIGGLVYSAPALVGWIVAVVLAAIMLRRGGARAERFLLVGACLMLLASILVIPTAMWLRPIREMTNVQTTFWFSIFGLIRGVIHLAGIICLVYAFWVKFKPGIRR